MSHVTFSINFEVKSKCDFKLNSKNKETTDQNKSDKMWCNQHKFNKTHVTKDCHFLNRLKKRNMAIKTVVEATDDSSETEGAVGYYGDFKSVQAVNPYYPAIHSFASVNEDHPMATSELLMICLRCCTFLFFCVDESLINREQQFHVTTLSL